MHISNRLRMVAELVTDCRCLADVGCDHGYLSIWLLRGNICERAVLMDLRKGPLSKAKENLAFFHMEERAETRLSDGLAGLSPGEADALVIAGMGGELMSRILTAYPSVTKSFRQLVLQPQSDIPKVRKTLHGLGFTITDEDRVMEDGKLYQAFRGVPGEHPEYSEADYISGAIGLKESGRTAELCFLSERIRKLKTILAGLPESDREEIRLKREEIERELAETRKAEEAFSE